MSKRLALIIHILAREVLCLFQHVYTYPQRVLLDSKQLDCSTFWLVYRLLSAACKTVCPESQPLHQVGRCHSPKKELQDSGRREPWKPDQESYPEHQQGQQRSLPHGLEFHPEPWSRIAQTLSSVATIGLLCDR